MWLTKYCTSVGQVSLASNFADVQRGLETIYVIL